MTGSDKVKIVADGKPEEEMTMTSSPSWSGCTYVSWLHLCVIYGLLGVYGLWAVTSYQLIRTSLLDELEVFQRKNPVAGELGLERIDHRRLGDLEALTEVSATLRRRRSADEPPAQGPAVLGGIKETPLLSRKPRDTDRRRRNNRRGRRNRDQRRRSQSMTGDAAGGQNSRQNVRRSHGSNGK